MPMQSLLYNVLVLLTFVDVPIWMKTKSIFQKLIAMQGEFPLSRARKGTCGSVNKLSCHAFMRRDVEDCTFTFPSLLTFKQ